MGSEHHLVIQGYHHEYWIEESRQRFCVSVFKQPIKIPRVISETSRRSNLLMEMQEPC